MHTIPTERFITVPTNTLLTEHSESGLSPKALFSTDVTEEPRRFSCILLAIRHFDLGAGKRRPIPGILSILFTAKS
jgi:hypothetical protein